MDQLTKCACKKCVEDIVKDIVFLAAVIGLFVVMAYIFGWIIDHFQIVVNLLCGLMVGAVIALVAMYIMGAYRDAKIACGWKPDEDENFIDYSEDRV
jgi:hypothetical protein